MNQSLESLVEALIRALRVDIEPEISSEHALSQLAGIVDTLEKLKRMTTWSPAIQRQRLQLMRAGCDRLAAQVREDELPIPGFACDADPQASDVTEERQIVDSEAELRTWIDWLFDSSATMPAQTHSRLDTHVRDTLAQLLRVERSAIPRADFQAMTAGSSALPLCEKVPTSTSQDNLAGRQSANTPETP